MPENGYTIKQIADILGGSANLSDESASIINLIIDSRKISHPEASLFFALKGRNDGHSFLVDVYKSGVRNFVVSNDSALIGLNDVNIIKVENTLEALQHLVSVHRKEFTKDVIGITGSNGKTIVKEWLFQLLSVDKNIVRSPKSYNSQIGVPLSVWQLNEDADLGIFEAGISIPGEMTHLEQIIQPTIGVLTNIGSAHDEGFVNKEQKIEEKLKLFEHCNLLIYPSKDMVGKEHLITAPNRFTWSFDASEDADLKVLNVKITGGKSILTANIKNHVYSVTIPFTDEAYVHNVVICWSAMICLGYTHEVIEQRMTELAAIEMRLKLRQGINNCTLINDSYNSDLASLEIALDFLHQQHQHHKRTVILSDIFQTGIPAKQLYSKVAALLRSKNIDRLIAIGPRLNSFKSLFPDNSEFFESTVEFTEQFLNQSFNNETVLLKGARSFGFERISTLLELKVHETVFEINLNALISNLNYFKSKLQPQTKMMAMVKAFSYGSGSYEIANVLQFHKVDYLAVAYVDEGADLRKAGIKLPIMVMSPEVSSFESLIEHNLEPEIYSFRILREFIGFLKNQGIPEYKIHLKIDTGMHRLGFEEPQIDELLEMLEQNPQIQIQSVFSHLVGSDEAIHDGFTRDQLSKLLRVCNKLENNLGYTFIKHIANSAAISRFPEAQLDMVRLGIGLYGIDSAVKNNFALQPIGTLKTTISQIREVPSGDSIGYNRRSTVDKPSRIATVKIGYADGYNRKLGNRVGCMLVNGQRVPIIGSVCMDMTMLDVTGIDCNETDEVIVFNDELRVEELADRVGTIPYELLTAISQRVKRIYVYE